MSSPRGVLGDGQRLGTEKSQGEWLQHVYLEPINTRNYRKADPSKSEKGPKKGKTAQKRGVLDAERGYGHFPIDVEFFL